MGIVGNENHIIFDRFSLDPANECLFLTQDAVAQYPTVRFPANRFPTDLAALIHERTEGDPLFMVNTTDYLVAERLIESMQIARQQKARSLELRAAMSLARLYHHRGKRKTALRLLTQSYGRFTEGFETVDLRDARALLAQLS